MGGKAKKKSSASKATTQKPSKYVVAPVTPVETRSGANKDKSSGLDAPTAGPSVLSQAAEGAAASPYQVSLEDLGARMLQMESVLTSASTTAPSTAPVKDTSPVELPLQDVSNTSSSSSGSSVSPSSSRSSSGSRSSSRSSHRNSRHSRRKQEKRDKRRKGKFDTSKYLRDGDKLNTYERLVLANLKMARKFYKKERDILGFLDHMILVAEKAERRVFASEALIGYDESVKDSAKEIGLKAFKKVDPANIVKTSFL